MSKVENLINDDIHGDIRLISETGEQVGVVTAEEGNKRAEVAGLDLVMISPSAVPPVCRIMDYGKFRYDQLKKVKEQRKNQKVIELKEIQLSMTIELHDMETKAKNAIKFLQNGDKVKIVLRMKGRQQAYVPKCIEVVNSFYKLIESEGTVDKATNQEGRNIIMIVSPNTANKK